MRQLDSIIPQNVKEVRSDDRCAETSARHNENSRRSEHYYYRDGGDNPQSQYQQQNNECNKHSQNIGGFMKPDSMQHGKLDVSNPKNVS